jgi:hypothetical protein
MLKNCKFHDILMTKYCVSFTISQVVCLLIFLKKCLFLDFETGSTILWIRVLIDSHLADILKSKESLKQINMIKEIIKHQSKDFDDVLSLRGNLKVIYNTVNRDLPTKKQEFQYSIEFASKENKI